ncbi:MAG: hypothetical protein RL030_1875 [Pseudomonadota bacterium]
MKITASILGASGALLVPFAVQAQAVEASSNTQLDEVVVTAQKRSERLQDVPISVSALSGEALENSGIRNMQDLGLVVPSLSIASAVGFTITYLRGVGSTAIGPGIEVPISIYLDGVYYASTTSSMFDLSNIERVEVLKGPQGTLFGRNATGGLIQVITRDPTQDFRMSGDLTYANYDAAKARVYVAGGIAENVAADFSIQASRQGEGWGTNLFTGTDVNKSDHNVALRSKWLFTPSDATKITLIGDYTDVDNSMNGQKIAPGSVPNPALNSPPQPEQDPWDMFADADPRFTNRNYGASLKFEQDVGFATLTSLTAYRDSKSSLFWDVDFTPVHHLTGDLVNLETQFTQELQLSSAADSQLQWTAGLFYFDAVGKYDPAGVTSGNGLFGPFTRVDPYGEQATRSVAGFGQGTYGIAVDTNLTIGVRYTTEKRTLSGYTNGFIGDSPAIPLGTTPKKSVTFSKPTYRVALDHRFSPEMLAYVSFNTGFKSGGWNTQFVTDPPFLPETINAYETGLKTDLFDRRLRLNTAAFYYDYKNIQVQKVGLASTGIINGAAATIYGADIDFEAAITDAFRISGSAAYTNATFDEFTNAPFGSPGGGVPTYPGDASGNDIPKSPSFQATIVGDYRIDLNGGAAVHLTGTYLYNSGYAHEADNIFLQPAVSRLNAAAQWVSATRRYNVRLWANNITNEAVSSYSSTLADGTRNVSYEAPRTYGVTVGVNLD